MVTITVGNSLTHIAGLDERAHKRLRALLSYTPDNFFAGGLPRPRYLLDARNYFPTGLLNRVIAFLRHEGVRHEVLQPVLPKIAPVGLKLRLNGTAPYPDQVAAMEKALEKGRGVISMPTGCGKSLVIALIAAAFDAKTLVIVPSLEIKRQLTEAFLGYFGATKDIRIENVDSKALLKAKDYDVLIIDEAHHVASKTFQTLNKRVWNGISRRFFLTATPFRNREDEQLLYEGIAGQVIHRVTYRQAVTAGYIVPVEAYYIDLPKQPVEGYTWAQVYSELVTKNVTRTELLAQLLQTIDAPTLCLVKEVAHGKALSGVSGLPFVHGQDEESRDYIRQFNAGEIKQLIGTTGVIGEGVDSKPAEWVIIAGLGKAKSAFMQQVGRGVRRYPGKESAKIILFRDPSHKFTLRHFREQCKVLKQEYGITPLKLDF